MSKSYGQLKSEYIRWKERQEATEMEAQAKIDIERLRQEVSDAAFWGRIEAEAPSLEEVFPPDYEDILDPLPDLLTESDFNAFGSMKVRMI